MPRTRRLDQLQTGTPIIDAGLLDANLRTMATYLPGARLRPHIKSHKCTELARRQ